jgi:UPF0755 protein
VSRRQSDKTANELRSKEAGYLDIQQKAAGKTSEKHTKEPSSTVEPPSRADAKKLVENRKNDARNAQHSQSKVVGSLGKDGTIHKTSAIQKASSGSPNTKKKPASSLSTAKSVSKKAPPPKMKKKVAGKKNIKAKGTVELPTTVFALLIVVIALALISLTVLLVRTNFISNWLPARSSSIGLPNGQEPYVIVVEPGMTARQVARLLEQAQVIESASGFERFLVSRGETTRIQQGSYVFPGPLEYEKVADFLVNRPASTRQVVVWDGYTIQDVDGLLVELGLAKGGEFISAANQLAKEQGLPFSEGWFLGGTYTLSVYNAPQELALKMYEAMLATLRPLLPVVSESNRTLADIIIIASMIQRETNKPEEMPQIAGIIYNRLAANMPLGIDATTRYELNDWKNPLQEADLEAQTPYNTRRKTGLPPTGIGAPGKSALEAAIRPAENNWYYYLHGSDSQIRFAVTLDEHKENIEKYR